MSKTTCTATEHNLTDNGRRCDCGYFLHLSEDQSQSLVKLVNDEIARNKAEGDEAYNTHWENLRTALGH